MLKMKYKNDVMYWTDSSKGISILLSNLMTYILLSICLSTNLCIYPSIHFSFMRPTSRIKGTGAILEWKMTLAEAGKGVVVKRGMAGP